MFSRKALPAWLLAAALLVVAFANGAAAGTSSISLNQLSQALHMGSQVTFTVATTRTDMPWVTVSCFQADRLVYQQTHGLFPSYYTDPVFTLGPTMVWTSGGASCTGNLFYFDRQGRARPLATAAFSVQ